MFLNICSANIADHVIDADICHEAFAYFLDEVEIIIEVLDDDSVPIEETCIESEEEKNGRINFRRKRQVSVYRVANSPKTSTKCVQQKKMCNP